MRGMLVGGGLDSMTKKEISKAIRELDRQQREEISILARPVEEKYWALKQAIKDQCEHAYRRDMDAGVCPWDEHWYCSICHKREYRCNEDIKLAYMDSHPELFEG